MEYKTLIDDYFRKVPEYYPEMYQDGFTPEEIMYAFRKQLRRQAEDERPVQKREPWNNYRSCVWRGGLLPLPNPENVPHWEDSTA